MALGRAVGTPFSKRARTTGTAHRTRSPDAAPGVWEPTLPAFAPMLEPQFQNVTPFTLRDRTQFLPDPQPSLTSRRYARDYTEVKLRRAGHPAPVRTADQTHIAHFWV